MAFGFQPALDGFGDAADVRLVESVVSDDQGQLVEIRLFSEQRERVQADIAVDDVLHAGLGLADVVHAAAELERAFSCPRVFSR